MIEFRFQTSSWEMCCERESESGYFSLPPRPVVRVEMLSASDIYMYLIFQSANGKNHKLFQVDLL